MLAVPLPPQALHLPFEDPPFRMAMALVACPEADWFEIDARYPDELAERRALLATRRDEVFAALPDSEAARAEALELIADHLPRHRPAWFARQGRTLRNHLTGEAWDLDAPPHDPLELAARLVQEDLCVIAPGAEGPCFTAGVVCFPSRWRLAEKIGKPLMAVHGPVPLYAERLGAAVDRFMGALKPGRVASRRNWSLTDDAALFQPRGKWRTDTDASITPDNAGDRIFLRAERQSFRLLPRSGAVLFGIRVHSYPLVRVGAEPGAAARLAAAVRALPEPIQAYKSFPVYGAALLAWLDRMSGSAG
jgi:hypothetical protein